MQKLKKNTKRWDECLLRLKDVKNANVAEVGVWKGKNAARLLAGKKDITLYMIDRWKRPPAGDSYVDSGASIPGKPDSEFIRAYHLCVELAKKYRNRAHLIKCDSAVSAERFEDEKFDLVFIDGDHSKDGCQRDIKAWLPKVKKGGWIGGHDYDHPDQGDVKVAVDSMFSSGVVLGGNRTWWVRI